MENLLIKLGLEADSHTVQWASALAILILLAVGGTILHRVILAQMGRIAGKTGSNWDDHLMKNVGRPTYFVMLAIAAGITVQFQKLPVSPDVLEGGIKTAFIIFMFWTFERSVYTLIKENVLLSSLEASSKAIISTILRVSVIVVGILMVLDSAGISITPLLASLGVGSVAVALALQDTLSNLFSGLYILADKPFRIGDYVELEGGVAGYVQNIGWRSTKIRMFSNNVVVVPNSKVASSTLTNYDLLDTETSVYVKCGVAYGTDLNKAEALIVKIGKETLARVTEGVPDFDPFVRFNNFGDSSVDFTVILRAKKYDNHFILKHEFIKALHSGLAENGIEIPFPQRDVHMKPSP